MEGVDPKREVQKRRAITDGEVEGVRRRLQTEIAIRHVLEARTFERAREQEVCGREQTIVNRERMLD